MGLLIIINELNTCYAILQQVTSKLLIVHHLSNTVSTSAKYFL